MEGILPDSDWLGRICAGVWVHKFIDRERSMREYKGQDEWGGVFQMNPDKKYLSESEEVEAV